MRRFKPKDPSLLAKYANGEPEKARAVLAQLANDLDACGDVDLNGFKKTLIDALRRIADGEKADNVLGLAGSAHAKKIRRMRDEKIALLFYDRRGRNFKEEQTAKAIAEFWGITPRRVHQIVKPMEKWALAEIASRGGTFKISLNERKILFKIKELLKA